MLISYLQDHHIYPVSIPTPFAVGDVYCYLINDEKTVFVDCGHKSEAAYGLIKEQMEDLGLTLRDLDEIWLTHGHPDHFGMAAQLADETGAVLFGHHKERANFASNDDGVLFEQFFEHHHIPPKLIDMMVDQLQWLQQFQEYINPEWVGEGDVLSSGSLKFNVRHTPGHAPGHLTFYSDSGIIFGGDILLEHISTNALINFDAESGERNKSLLQYRESLQWIRELEGWVLPGHGKFIENISKVADHHLGNQKKRYEGIKRLLSEKPYSLFELSQVMFTDAIKDGAVFLVLSEVIGYLDWGIERGEIVYEDNAFSLMS